MNLAQQAERVKLARLLDVDADALHMLDTVDADSVRQLRSQVADTVYARQAPMFKRVIAASKLLPVPALALITEKVMGPLLAGKLASQMDVARGIGIAKRLPTPFLATLCLHLDPVRARPLIEAMPAARVLDIAMELARRDEHVTMGRFVDVVDEAVIMQVIEQLDDPHLLRTAFLAENKARLDAIVTRLPEQRLESLIHCAASDAGLWPEALGLLQHISPPVRSRLANLAAQQDDRVLASMAQSVAAGDLWSDALPILASMGEAGQARFANLAPIQSPEILLSAIGSAARDGHWPVLLPLLDLMDATGRTRCAAIAAELDGERLLSLAKAASDEARWPVVLDLARRMPDDARRETVAMMGMAPDAVVATLLSALEAEGLWSLVDEAWPTMGNAAKARLQRVAEQQDLSDRLPSE